MTNQYFANAKPVKFDYFKKFPERRRLAIVSDNSYRIYDQKHLTRDYTTQVSLIPLLR